MTRDHDTWEGIVQTIAVDQIGRTGLHHPTRPGTGINANDWPTDLDRASFDELGWWLGHLAGWLAYARAQLGLTDAVRVYSEDRLRPIRARAYHASTSEKVTDKRADVDADADVEAQRDLIARAHSQAKLLTGIVDGLVDKYAAVSREIARRESEVRISGSAGNVRGAT